MTPGHSHFGWREAARLARRDLDTKALGLRLLFVCLVLGVAMLAAIGSMIAAIDDELGAQGQEILGGDIQVETGQREFAADERAAFAELGDLSETIRIRSMAQAGEGAVLSELKGVDGAYPLYGALTLADGSRVTAIDPGAVLVGQALVDRLDIGIGDEVRFGEARFAVAGIIGDEPDRVGEGFTLGPVALVSLDGLRATGLLQPGSLYETKYRLRLPSGADAGTVREGLEERFAARGWDFDDRDNAAPGLSRFLGRMGQFLTLIGLTALIIAGIGMNNGVSAYLTARRDAIATVKALGATSGDIARIYGMQVGAVALAGIAAGVLLGASVVPLVLLLAGDVLPVNPGFTVNGGGLALAALYGALITFIFAVPPIARARVTSAAAMFRARVAGERQRDWRAVAIVAVATLALLALVLGTASDLVFVAGTIVATLGVLAILLALGRLVRWLARRAPRPRRPLLRLAIANLHRPGSQTPALVTALGLSLTLFVTIAAIQTSLDAEIQGTVPERAPDLFVLDVPSTGQGELVEAVERAAPGAELNIVPALRGTVVAIGDTRVADMEDQPEGQFLLRGERGVTYSPVLPEGSELEAGEWWPEDYTGPPLVSLDIEQARPLGLDIGDTLTVSVLGREIEAEIASLRTINWDTMGFNYVMVFTPDTFAAAPHTLTATVTLADGGSKPATTRALLDAFSGASVIDTGEVLVQVRTLLEQMAAAIIFASSVTFVAGIAVLVGAVLASRAARNYDSVLLKTFGATRAQVLGGQAVEYALLALILGLLALLLGGLAAWYVIVQIFDFGWQPSWAAVGLAILAGGGATLVIGVLGSLKVMNARPAEALREA